MFESLTPCEATPGDPEVEELKELLHALDRSVRALPVSVQRSLIGEEGLRRLAAAMTILLTDYGGTAPRATCEAIAEAAPDLYKAFGSERVQAVCKEIQHSEIPEQSALFQDLFHRFNTQYFCGCLPDYQILVVFDAWYWEIERCGYAPAFPPAAEASGFIDFPARRIFIRYLAEHTNDRAMEPWLIHEMAHAATDGDHGDAWQAEMARLKRLGAPVSPDEFDVPAHSPCPRQLGHRASSGSAGLRSWCSRVWTARSAAVVFRDSTRRPAG
jgi:hypothetical protein